MEVWGYVIGVSVVIGALSLVLMLAGYLRDIARYAERSRRATEVLERAARMAVSEYPRAGLPDDEPQ